MELATEIRALALPLAVPVLGTPPPPEELPPEPELPPWLEPPVLGLLFPPPEELLPLEPDGAFFASLLVSFAIVMAPTVPSALRPLVRWKDFTASSVISP